MAMTLNEEQRYLKDTAHDFFAENSPVSALRALRDTNDSTGYNPELWQQMVDLGWTGITFKEEDGGLDFGFMGLGAVLEESGRTLTASPLMSSVVLAGSAIALAGSDSQKKDMLPGIIDGSVRYALALEESGHHNPLATSLSAVAQGDDYLLNGKKVFVLDGNSAEQLIVVARTAGKPGDAQGLSLLLIDANAAGINRTRTAMVDSRDCANIEFCDVKVSKSALLGQLDQAFTLLDQVLDRGRICIAAEMLGSLQEIFERTVGYLKERKQFGVLIGSFQALQHRASKMFVEIEMAKTAVMAGLSALDASSEVNNSPKQVAYMASLAKYKLSEAFALISSEAVQLHGGVGVTDELEIGLFLKRARVTQQMFGDISFHQDRFATMNRY